MRLLIASFFTFFVLSALPAAAQTSPTANAYEGRAPVSDQSTAARDGGLRQALAQVIARVSGPGSSAHAGAVLVSAPQLVQRYGFAPDDGGALQLVASFDRNAVYRPTRHARPPGWGN